MLPNYARSVTTAARSPRPVLVAARRATVLSALLALIAATLSNILPAAASSAPRVTSITVGGGASYALMSDGGVYAWGAYNDDGRLGVGNTTAQLSPTKIAGALAGKAVTAITTYTPDPTYSWTFARTADGGLYAWGGNNYYGQLGLGNTASQASPVKVGGALAGKSVTSVSVAGSSTYALTSEDTLYAWGDNSGGELGLGNTTRQTSPVKVGGALAGKTVTGIVTHNFVGTGMTSVWAVTSDGSLYSWGDNYYGQLGVGGAANQTSPVKVSGALAGKIVTNVVSGGRSTFAVTSDGGVYAWGDNTDGVTLGLGNVPKQTSPVKVEGALAGETISRVATNGYSTFALTTEGTVYAWGDNTPATLGVGNDVDQNSPVKVAGALAGQTVTGLTVGGLAVYALTSDGALYGWGDNMDGRLGVGNDLDQLSPVRVAGALAGKTVTGISPGAATYAWTSDGAVYAWGGDNGYGWLGVGDTAKHVSPARVSGALAGQTVRNVAIAGYQVFALSSDGNVFAWGGDGGGLGVGDTAGRTTPVKLAFTELQAMTSTPSPAISGTAIYGKTLTAKTGTWKPTGVTLRIQWFRDSKPISGGTKTSYKPVSSDVGHKLTVRVTGTKPGYQTVTRTSKAVTVAGKPFTKTGSVKIIGTAKVSKTLKAAKTGTWSPKPTKYTYQWLRNGKAIPGATKYKYRLVKADKGKTVKVKVTATKAGYKAVVKTSKATKKVKK